MEKYLKNHQILVTTWATIRHLILLLVGWIGYGIVIWFVCDKALQDSHIRDLLTELLSLTIWATWFIAMATLLWKKYVTHLKETWPPLATRAELEYPQALMKNIAAEEAELLKNSRWVVIETVANKKIFLAKPSKKYQEQERI